MLLQDCLVMLRVLFSRHTGQLKSFTIHLIIQIKVSDGLKAWQPFLSARPKHSLWSSRMPLAALSDSHMMFNLDSLWSWWKGINAWKEIVKLMPCYFKSITYSWVKGCWEHMGFMSSRETDLPTCVCVCVWWRMNNTTAIRNGGLSEKRRLLFKLSQLFPHDQPCAFICLNYCRHSERLFAVSATRLMIDFCKMEVTSIFYLFFN